VYFSLNVKNGQRIPKKIIDTLNLEPSGTLVLSVDNTNDVLGSYSPCKDGRMLLSREAWETVIARNNFKINDTVMFLFHPYGKLFTSTRGITISVDVI
jgi:antitoxin component of MazEF toxin-antitoxin module